MSLVVLGTTIVTTIAPWVGEILDRLVELKVGRFNRIGNTISYEVQKILRCFSETTVERVTLEKLYAQGDRIDRFRLVEFQAALGQESDAIPRLLSLLREPNSDLHFRIASALAKLAKTSNTTRPGLVQWLEQNPNDDGISSSIDCLWSIVVE